MVVSSIIQNIAQCLRMNVAWRTVLEIWCWWVSWTQHKAPDLRKKVQIQTKINCTPNILTELSMKVKWNEMKWNDLFYKIIGTLQFHKLWSIGDKPSPVTDPYSSGNLCGALYLNPVKAAWWTVPSVKLGLQSAAYNSFILSMLYIPVMKQQQSRTHDQNEWKMSVFVCIYTR